MLALCYMHGQDVSHRDLKPENLMVMERENPEDLFIKLTDFGFACFFDPSRKMDVILGTPCYMAPELAKGDEYDCRVDVWSLGVITHQLLSGDLPFTGESPKDIQDAILHKDLQMYGTKWCKVSKQAIDFVRTCLNRTARDRPFVDALFDHPFIKKWVENPVIEKGVGLQISESIATFKKTSVLQQGVLSLLSNLLSNSGELDQYIKAFEVLDTSHDGCISKEEMKKGLKTVQNLNFQISSE